MESRNYKAEGLVLRARILGEADRLITLLTYEKGKFDAVARGARKIKSKLAAGVDLFNRGAYTFYQGRTWPLITGQETLERFNSFREDPGLYPYGLYLSELTDRLVAGEQACAETYRLLLEGWRALDTGKDRFLTCRAFELKLASFSGSGPCLDRCTHCGSKGVGFFSPSGGGAFCPECRAPGVFPVGKGTLALARRLVEAPLAGVNTIRPSEKQKQELALLTRLFIEYHFDLGEIKSRKLIVD